MNINNAAQNEALSGLEILATQEYRARSSAYDSLVESIKHSNVLVEDGSKVTGYDIAKGMIMNRERLRDLYPDSAVPAAHELVTIPFMYDSAYAGNQNIQSSVDRGVAHHKWEEGIDFFIVPDELLRFDGTSTPGMSVFLSPKAFQDVNPLGSSLLWDSAETGGEARSVSKE